MAGVAMKQLTRNSDALTKQTAIFIVLSLVWHELDFSFTISIDVDIVYGKDTGGGF
jgi:hypothetical protein